MEVLRQKGGSSYTEYIHRYIYLLENGFCKTKLVRKRFLDGDCRAAQSILDQAGHTREGGMRTYWNWSGGNTDL